jgi:4-diphosphocytidyl-2-C-methyl-D-erythritol kinase
VSIAWFAGNRERAPAKINLSLSVLGRRADGYHDLDSLIVFADCADELTLIEGPGAMTVSGPFAEALSSAGGDTLTARARAFWHNQIGILPDFAMHLDKNLPIAAGIGGGSADAAALLRLLERLTGCGLAPAHYPAMVDQIGADVPACLVGRPLRLRARGEIIQPLQAWPEFDAVLVNPGLKLPTKEVFAHWSSQPRPEHPRQFSTSIRGEALAYLKASGNDLLSPALKVCPPLGLVLSALEGEEGARHAGLSGSGATCFALFDSPSEARDAAVRLSAKQPHWWIRPVVLQGIGHVVD